MRSKFLQPLWLSAVVALVAVPHALADIRIEASPGGEIAPFVELFSRVRATGQRVVIDGPCFSACTLVLSVVPQSRICVTRRAVFGFHAARSIAPNGHLVVEPEASAIVLSTYPPRVRAWIAPHGGLTRRLLLLRGHTLAGMFRVCR